jgi:hypothetical protein
MKYVFKMVLIFRNYFILLNLWNNFTIIDSN